MFAVTQASPEILLSQGKLRPWKKEDADALARHANNRKIAENMRDGFPFPYTIDDANTWLDMCLKEMRHLFLAIEVDGEAAGSIGILFKENVYRFSAEIGYWLGETHWRKGICSEAIVKVTDHIFATTDIVRIYADIFSSNFPSMKTIEKAGYQFEGINKRAVYKNGEFFDQHVYCKIR